jgi:Na+/proline symporter
MTTFSAWMFTGAASFVYNTGWFGFLYFAVKPIGFTIGFLLAATKWRRARVTSPVEYVEDRFNHVTRLVLSIVLVVSMMYWPGHHLASVAKIAAPALFPGSTLAIDALILFFGGFVLVYSIAGGIWAVSMTDVLQFIVLLSVCVVLIVAIFTSNEVGSLSEMVRAVPSIEFTHSYRPGTVYTHWYISGFVIAGIFGNVVGDKAQRFFMVRDEKAAMKTGWLALVLFLTSPILFGLPPLVGKVLWPEITQLAAFAGESKPDESIFIAVVVKFLPAGMIGLFIAAMVAASMSALDSVWNTVSSIVSIDLYKGHIRPNASEKELLKVGRITVAILAISAVSMALLIVHSSLGIFTISNIVLGLVGIPVTIPLLVGLIARTPVSWSAIPAILSGIIITCLVRFGFNWTLGPQYLAVIAAGLLLMFTSRRLGGLYLSNRYLAVVSSVAMWLAYGTVIAILRVPTMESGVYLQVISAESGLLTLLAAVGGLSTLSVIFLPFYARDLSELNPSVERFFEKLQTPIDVESELGQDVGVSRPNRIIGWSATGLAAVPATLLLLYQFENWILYTVLLIILVALGQLFLFMSDDD